MGNHKPCSSDARWTAASTPQPAAIISATSSAIFLAPRCLPLGTVAKRQFTRLAGLSVEEVGKQATYRTEGRGTRCPCQVLPQEPRQRSARLAFFDAPGLKMQGAVLLPNEEILQAEMNRLHTSASSGTPSLDISVASDFVPSMSHFMSRALAGASSTIAMRPIGVSRSKVLCCSAPFRTFIGASV